MTQAERDRLVALQKAKKKLITQTEGSGEGDRGNGATGETTAEGSEEKRRPSGDPRNVRKRMRYGGRHGNVRSASKRKIEESEKEKVVKILSQEVYRGFGPTLASEYLAKRHRVVVSRETLRRWMIEAKLWRSRKQQVDKIHQWRPRRSRYGSWCNAERTYRGTPASMTGWKAVGRRCC